MELELQNKTDIDSKEVIHKEAIFKEKNTLLYQDVLTNYTYRTYQGYPTTTGNDIIITDNTIAYSKNNNYCELLTIDSNTFKADKHISYPLDSQGDIIDTIATYEGCLVTIMNDPTGEYRVQLNGTTIFKCKYPMAILKNTKVDDNVCIVEAHSEDTNININIVNLDLINCSCSLVKETHVPYDSKLCFCSNNAYINCDTILIGSDWEDQTKSGTLIINETTCCYLPFMGRLGIPNESNSYIFGEPFPNIDTYTICTNKEIRFDMPEMPVICASNGCLSSIYNWGYYASCVARINSLYNKVDYADPVSLIYAYNVCIHNNEVSVEKCLVSPTCKIDHCGTVYFLRCGYECPQCTTPMSFAETTCRSFINPTVTQSPGDSWTPNCFLSCIITNISCNRNRNFQYSRYGTQILFNERLVTNLESWNCSCPNPNFECPGQFHFNGAFESVYCCLTMDAKGNVKQTAAEKMTNKGWNVWECARNTLCSNAINESYPALAGMCSSTLPTTEYSYCDTLKWIRTTSVVDSSKAWPKIQHTYDWNLGDLNKSWKYGDLKVIRYHGLELGYSLNGVLLNNINFEGNAIDVCCNEDTIVIPVGNTIYRYSKCIPLTIDKLSDFNFNTNVVVLNNLIREDRNTGSLSLFPSSLSLIPEFEIDVDKLPVFTQPALGNTANDTLFVNYAYNTNMESKYASTSALFPSYQLGIFVPSDAGSAMNQTIFGTLNTIVSPVIDTCYPVCMYATHTLCSTSVDYLYTCSNGSVDIDNSLVNTNWWTDAGTNYFPIALNSSVTNVNSLTSTVCLSQDYSVTLSTCDNAMMTVYNNSKQVYRGASLFTIYGSQYYYDGQAIYYLGNDGTNQLAAYGIGLRYLAASSNEAFFFSNADRKIYSFSGSNTMNITLNAAAVGDVIDAMYDSTAQLLWILFEDGLFVMSTTSDESSFFKDIKGVKLLSNIQGITIIREDEPNISLSIHAFSDLLPLDLETEWIGMNDTGYKIPYFDILIYNDGKEHDIEITCATLCNGKIQENKKHIHINKSDFNEGKFYRCRVTPIDNNGNAAKVKIYSEGEISIQGIIIQAQEEYVGAGNI